MIKDGIRDITIENKVGLDRIYKYHLPSLENKTLILSLDLRKGFINHDVLKA